MFVWELWVLKVIFFDVNEILFDFIVMCSLVGEVLGGWDDLLLLWFFIMLYYLLVDLMIGCFYIFGEIGVVFLLMVVEIEGIELIKV